MGVLTSRMTISDMFSSVRKTTQKDDVTEVVCVKMNVARGSYKYCPAKRLTQPIRR